MKKLTNDSAASAMAPIAVNEAASSGTASGTLAARFLGMKFDLAVAGIASAGTGNQDGSHDESLLSHQSEKRRKMQLFEHSTDIFRWWVISSQELCCERRSAGD